MEKVEARPRELCRNDRLKLEGHERGLRELRHRDQLFDSSQLSVALADAKRHKDKVPAEFSFDFADKADILFRLIMPKLDDVMSNESAQTGDKNGFELFRHPTRKIDPPQADLAFDLNTEIEGLGKHVCSNFAQTARFLQMLDQRVRDFVLETGEQFLLASFASVMRRAVDSDTADRMDEAGVDFKDFTKVEEFVGIEKAH